MGQLGLHLTAKERKIFISIKISPKKEEKKDITETETRLHLPWSDR
jgi:hypothetical protein